MPSEVKRPIARMPGLTSLVNDQNAVVEELQKGFPTFEEYRSWLIRAAALSMGNWPTKDQNILENRHVISFMVQDGGDYDVDMAAKLSFELSKILIDIYQSAQRSIIQKLMEEDTTDKIQRRKMEGVK